MSLIVLERAAVSFGARTLFRDLDLRVGEGDHVGLVGRNGTGKSTLLRVLAGVQGLSAGVVRRANTCRVGYLPQDVEAPPDVSVLEAVLGAVPGRADVEDRLGALEAALEASQDPDEQMELAIRLGDVRDELDHLDTFYSEREARRILEGLGFGEAQLAQPMETLSGGWRMRAVLAGLLFQRPDVLLLDEPTNHLDVPSVRWLDAFLRDAPHALVLISHDRAFLNRHIDRVVAFEVEGVRLYKGDFEAYRAARAGEEELLAARARNAEKELRDMKRFVERFRSKATKARQAQSRAKQVKRLEAALAEQPSLESAPTLSFRFPEVPRTGRDVLRLEGVSKAFGPLSLYRGLTRTVHAGDRVAIIGVNGAGKTTLLKMMAGELAPDAGRVTLGANVKVGYYAQHHGELLHDQVTVLDEVWSAAPERGQADIRGVCGAFLFRGDDVDKRIGVLSGGERARVLLARMLAAPGNLLLMDEPTNHLDLESSEALAEALAGFGGTLVFVSHNTSFVNRLATKVWDIEGGDVVEYPGNLASYEQLRAVAEREREAQGGGAESRAAPSPKKARSKRRRKGRKRVDAAPAAQVAPQREEPGAASSSQPTASGKGEVPRRSRRRRRRSRATSAAELRQRIDLLAATQETLGEALADPALYRDAGRFRETLAEYEANQRKLEELRGRLEGAADAEGGGGD